MHVVWSFLSGFLFADDVTRVYKALGLPVWAVHGRRGDFVDYGKEFEVADRSNWTFDVFDTGAMPQFERLDDVVRSYDAFVDTLDQSNVISHSRRDAAGPLAKVLVLGVGRRATASRRNTGTRRNERYGHHRKQGRRA